MQIDDELGRRFVCPKCSHSRAFVKRFAVTGTGLSRMFDIQHNEFIAASCQYCGYTEIYNPEVLEGHNQLGTLLDILFGG